MIKRGILKNLEVYGLTLFAVILINIISRGFLYINLIPTYFTIDLFFYTLLLSPLLFLNNKIFNYIYSNIILFVFVALFVLNKTYYDNLDTPFYIQILQFLGEAKEVVSAHYINWWVILTGIGYMLVFNALNILIDHFFPYNKAKGYLLRGLILALTSVAISSTGTMITKAVIYRKSQNIDVLKEAKNGDEVINFFTKYLKLSSYKNYGMVGCYLSEYSIYWGNGVTPDYNPDKPNPIVESDYNGILEGYNIFTIMIETGIDTAITNEFTPNLYYLMNNGINCKYNYSKNKTSVSEIIGFTGSYPTDGINYNYDRSASDSIYKLKIDIENTLPKILNETYKTSFFHDGEGLYARDNLMGQFGFEHYLYEYNHVHSYGSPGWDFDGSYELDSDYIDIVLDRMVSSDRFYTFWTTLSTHGPYIDERNDEVTKRDQLFEEMGYGPKFDSKYNEVYGSTLKELDEVTYKEFKHLICAFMNLDEAVGKIINKLKEMGKFDTTLFVVYGDHEAYYQKLSKNITVLNSNFDPELYKTTLFFSNPKLKEVFYSHTNTNTFDYFTSPYVIVPTILDLLGIEYDDSLYFSPSIFRFNTEFDGIFYSNELNAFMTNHTYSSDSFTFDYKDQIVTEKDLETILNLQGLRLTKLIAINNYYKNHMNYVE